MWKNSYAWDPYGPSICRPEKVEDTLCQYEGVKSANAYTYYGGDNVILVGVTLEGVNESEIEKIREFAMANLEQVTVPTRIEVV